jgi:hypothetical protein
LFYIDLFQAGFINILMDKFVKRNCILKNATQEEEIDEEHFVNWTSLAGFICELHTSKYPAKTNIISHMKFACFFVIYFTLFNLYAAHPKSKSWK